MGPGGPAPRPGPRRRSRLGRLRRGLRSFLSRDWKGAVALVVVVLLLAVLLSMPFSTVPRSQLSAYDDDWDDISVFRADIEQRGFMNLTVRTVSTSAAALTTYDDARGMFYMAIGVERPYTFAEWRAIRLFIQRGGQVMVADDYGYGNSILRYNGIIENPAVSHLTDGPETQYVFSGERLSDVRVDRNPQLVRLRVPIYEDLEYDVLLNDPSCFVENSDWRGIDVWTPDWARPPPPEIANSTASAWIDENRDGIRDPGEKVGEYPVILFMEGMLLISDPSVFTNDMYGRVDNRRFAHALMQRMVPVNGTVIIDESLHIEPGVLAELDDVLVRPLYTLTGEEWPIYSGLLVLLLGLVGLFLVGRRPLRRYEPHKDRLEEPRTLEFGNPYNWLADYYEVRGLLLQRMRYAYGLDPDDLQRLPPEIVAQLLGDQYLAQFVLQPVRVDPVALQAALADIGRWEPPADAERLVKRSEAFLADLSVDAPPAWSPQVGMAGGPGGGLQ